MQSIVTRLANLNDRAVELTRKVDWLGPLALRLYLVPVFWVAGMNKASGFENVVSWFGNTEWGLGLPVPGLLAFLATATEVVGAVALLLGLATRWFALPLMATMLVAIGTVHWDNGWQAVHDPQSPFASQFTLGIEADDVADAGERLDRARTILKENGNYEWLTGKGNLVISNSGIEWAATYLVMLLALFFTGAGRVSLDHLLAKKRSTLIRGTDSG